MSTLVPSHDGVRRVASTRCDVKISRPRVFPDTPPFHLRTAHRGTSISFSVSLADPPGAVLRSAAPLSLREVAREKVAKRAIRNRTEKQVADLMARVVAYASDCTHGTKAKAATLGGDLGAAGTAEPGSQLSPLGSIGSGTLTADSGSSSQSSHSNAAARIRFAEGHSAETLAANKDTTTSTKDGGKDADYAGAEVVAHLEFLHVGDGNGVVLELVKVPLVVDRDPGRVLHRALGEVLEISELRKQRAALAAADLKATQAKVAALESELAVLRSELSGRDAESREYDAKVARFEQLARAAASDNRRLLADFARYHKETGAPQQPRTINHETQHHASGSSSAAVRNSSPPAAKRSRRGPTVTVDRSEPPASVDMAPVIDVDQAGSDATENGDKGGDGGAKWRKRSATSSDDEDLLSLLLP